MSRKFFPLGGSEWPGSFVTGFVSRGSNRRDMEGGGKGVPVCWICALLLGHLPLAETPTMSDRQAITTQGPKGTTRIEGAAADGEHASEGTNRTFDTGHSTPLPCPVGLGSSCRDISRLHTSTYATTTSANGVGRLCAGEDVDSVRRTPNRNSRGLAACCLSKHTSWQALLATAHGHHPRCVSLPMGEPHVVSGKRRFVCDSPRIRSAHPNRATGRPEVNAAPHRPNAAGSPVRFISPLATSSQSASSWRGHLT